MARLPLELQVDIERLQHSDVLDGLRHMAEAHDDEFAQAPVQTGAPAHGVEMLGWIAGFFVLRYRKR